MIKRLSIFLVGSILLTGCNDIKQGETNSEKKSEYVNLMEYPTVTDIDFELIANKSAECFYKDETGEWSEWTDLIEENISISHKANTEFFEFKSDRRRFKVEVWDFLGKSEHNPNGDGKSALLWESDSVDHYSLSYLPNQNMIIVRGPEKSTTFLLEETVKPQQASAPQGKIQLEKKRSSASTKKKTRIVEQLSITGEGTNGRVMVEVEDNRIEKNGNGGCEWCGQKIHSLVFTENVHRGESTGANCCSRKCAKSMEQEYPKKYSVARKRWN